MPEVESKEPEVLELLLDELERLRSVEELPDVFRLPLAEVDPAGAPVPIDEL